LHRAKTLSIIGASPLEKDMHIRLAVPVIAFLAAAAWVQLVPAAAPSGLGGSRGGPGPARGSDPNAIREMLRQRVASHRDLAMLNDSVPAHQLKGHTDGILSVAYSPDGRLLASGSADHMIKLWDASTFKEVRTLEGHASIILNVRFTPDSKHLLSSSYDSKIIQWNVQTGEIEQVYQQDWYANSMEIMPDNQHFITANTYAAMYWQMGADQGKQYDFGGKSVRAIAVSRTEKLAAGTKTGDVLLVEAATGKLIAQHHRQTIVNGQPADDLIASIRFLSDDAVLIGDHEGFWKWDLKADKIDFVSAAPYPGYTIMIDDNRVVFAVDTILMLQNLNSPGAHQVSMKETFHGLALSPKGDFLALAKGGKWGQGGWQSAGPGTLYIMDMKKLLAGLSIETVAARPPAGSNTGTGRGGAGPAAKMLGTPWD
jgi:hypothetical protein